MRALVLLLLLPLASAQIVPVYHQIPDPQEYPPCDTPDPVLFADVGVATENLLFHDGTLYLTAFGDGLWQAHPDGSFEQIVADPPAPGLTPLDAGSSMMGIAARDGALYVSQGLSILTPVDARILRFDLPGAPEYTVVADGFDGLNGMVAAPDGNLYVAHGFNADLYQVRPDGSWSVWAQIPTVNGLSLHPDGDRLVYAAVNDIGSAVRTISLDDPSDTQLVFTFNAVDPMTPAADAGKALLPKTIDDLVVLPDGRVVVAAHERLEILMGDPSTGEACILKDNLSDAPTSVRLADGFGAWDGWVFSTDNAGEIWAMQVVDVAESEAPATENPPTPVEGEDTPMAWWTLLALVAIAARRRP